MTFEDTVDKVENTIILEVSELENIIDIKSWNIIREYHRHVEWCVDGGRELLPIFFKADTYILTPHAAPAPAGA